MTRCFSVLSNSLIAMSAAGMMVLALNGGAVAIADETNPLPACLCKGPGGCPTVTDQSSCYGKFYCEDCVCVDAGLGDWYCADPDTDDPDPTPQPITPTN